MQIAPFPLFQSVQPAHSKLCVEHPGFIQAFKTPQILFKPADFNGQRRRDDDSRTIALEPPYKIKSFIINFMASVERARQLRILAKHPVIQRPKMLGRFLIGPVAREHNDKAAAPIGKRAANRDRVACSSVQVTSAAKRYNRRKARD